jgi:prepilin signal peptidase PulO-like enzyme (type II secretory pathway)
MVLLWIFVFIFGTIIGSFLNVVIFRHGTGMGLGGRSRCMTSGKVLRWYELIPIVSFLIQGGRSRNDGSKISWQYPLVEFLTGVLFVFSFLKSAPLLWSGDTASFFVLTLFLMLSSVFVILIAVYDAKHMIIPNEFIYPLIGISFASLFVSLSPLGLTLPSLSALLSGPLTALPFFLLWLISRGRWMGFADAKVALCIGWFLGILPGFFAILLSFWIGAVFGVLILALGKLHGFRVTIVPFGPFLLTGLILTFLYNMNMESFLLLFI